MLDALERSMSALDASVHAQRQLVADASHELRTPVTSLRTNIEILQQQGQDMDPEDSQRLLADVVEQTEELTLLMNDLIDLARGEEARADAEELRLDMLVSEVIERARRRTPATVLQEQLEPTIVTGVPARLERAVSNLIDNAVKYSPPDEPVEVTLRAGELTVRDHGTGISAEDLPYVFDRFYRGAEARGRPGSGLGLAIVRQVASQQRGSVTAEPPPAAERSCACACPAPRRSRRPPHRPPRAEAAAGTAPRRGAARRALLRATRRLAKARRREPVAAAKRAREMRPLAVADQPRHVVHRDRALLHQQLRADRHPPREQILAGTCSRRTARTRAAAGAASSPARAATIASVSSRR